MNIINAIDTKLCEKGDYFRQHRTAALWTGIGIYTLFFVIMGLFIYLPPLLKTNTLLAEDGVAQNLNHLLNFRRYELNFFEALSNGNFELSMFNFNYSLGTDFLTSSAMITMPFLPIFLLVALVPETGVALFLSFVVIFASYISGITFILMCRHFRASELWGGVFACLYVFCGNYLITGVYNMHFLYMYIIFPVMIIGIDRVINDKNGLLLAFSIFFISLSGVTLIVYTVPFVVVFALIRVYYVKKQHYFKNLVKYFLRGMLYTVLGMLVAGVIFLPTLYTTLNSARQVSLDSLNWPEMLTPSITNLQNMFFADNSTSFLGMPTALLPIFIYSLITIKGKQELKCYGITAVCLISLPIIGFGLNGFQYESLCRWGFIPITLVCFIMVYYAPRITKITKFDAIITIACLGLFIVLFTFKLGYIAMIGTVLVAIVGAITPLRKIFTRLFMYIGNHVLNWSKRLIKEKKYLAIFIAYIFAIILITIVLVAIAAHQYVIKFEFLIAFVAAIVLAFLAYKRKIRSGATGMLILVFAVGSSAFYYSGYNMHTLNISDFSSINNQFKELEQCDNSPNRIACLETENNDIVTASDIVSDESVIESETMYSNMLNASLKYGIPFVDAFYNTIDSDLMRFLQNSELDAIPLSTYVEYYTFARREAIYSLLGVEYLYSANGINNSQMYGTEEMAPLTFNDFDVTLLRNNYALPLGVTFDTTISKDAFEALNPAELSYAMMDSVYLENCDIALTPSDNEYSRKLNFDLKQNLRGITTDDITCYDNEITINDDVSNGFLYIRFKNITTFSLSSMLTESCKIKIDGNEEILFDVDNSNSSWPWKLQRDNYTIALGYHENDVNALSFVSPFEFEEIELYYVPLNVFTDAYAKRCEETLQNVKCSANTVEGNISVSTDKILTLSLIHSNGWKAFVDGVETPVYKANGVFMGITLSKGEHDIRFEYCTPWLREGAVISVCSVALLIVLTYIHKRLSKKKTDVADK